MLRGRAWTFGDNVDTDQIIPAEYLVTMDNRELAKHAFEKARPEFAKGVAREDIVVAGRNFGCGSSREHAPRALMGAGISCVVAESFARIFFRNAINIGLPVIEARLKAKDGEVMVVDLSNGSLRNESTGESGSFASYPPFVMMVVEKGGLIPYTKEMLGCRR
ncbi:MAG: 3-isopropylmalate dehydratase small subunit [Candidatus Thermoplasmatota archaeon]|nr:3-isopropylmalate dehydratase small subunit [Candidatus Thermoplasmatota archaeon]